jgi:hypothetical protein
MLTAKAVADQLNEYLKFDAGAVHALATFQVDCNNDLADHPFVQVRSDGAAHSVGMLGLINGLLLSVGPDVIVGCFGGNGEIIRFESQEYEVYLKEQRDRDT